MFLSHQKAKSHQQQILILHIEEIHIPSKNVKI